jgi:hypothetical protein
MAESTFEELLREVDDFNGVELVELLKGLEEHPDSNLEFDDDN